MARPAIGMAQFGQPLSAIATLRSTSDFWRSGCALLLCALSGPVWKVILVSLPGASLTVGRALLLLTAVLLVVDALRAHERPSLSRPAWLLCLAFGALWLWVVINTLALGCRCAGEVAGYSEVAALAILATLAATFEPRLRAAIVVAVVVGCGLSAALALLGVEGLTTGARNSAKLQTRLTGPFGNPNYLAFAISPGLPAAIVLLRVRNTHIRVLAGLCIALIAVALLLTYSRGGLIATAAGAAVVLVLMQPRRSRARRLTGLALLVAAATGAAVYPAFTDARRTSNTPPPDALLRAVDVGGWDARQQGAIPRGPAEMVNRGPDVLEVRASTAGEGASQSIGLAARESRHEVRFQARTADGRAQRLGFAVDDRNKTVVRMAAIGPAWRDLRIRWSAVFESQAPRFSTWAAATPGRFQLRAVTVAPVTRGRARAAQPLPVRLLGSEYAREVATLRKQKEARDIRTREVAAELAFRGFAAKPLFGIGWGRFPDYVAARSSFGRLATHNEYLRFMVELGLVGVLLLVGLVVVLADAARRRLDTAGLAIVGILVATGAGLVFVNGLVASSAALPFALAAGAACAAARTGAEPAP